MYYDDRLQAGRIIAQSVRNRFSSLDTVVIALSEGGVVVGSEICDQIGCALMYVLSEPIEIPGEDIHIGSVDQVGGFTPNQELSRVEAKEFTDEFHGYIDDTKRQVFSEINKSIHNSYTWDPALLNDKNIILIDDGLGDCGAVDVALNMLKPVRTKRIIIAAPVADVSTVDHLHIVADELMLLDVRSNFLGTDHYYTDNNKPSKQDAVNFVSRKLTNIVDHLGQKSVE